LTPQELSDYKMRWMRNGSYAVRIHSDLEYTAKAWCKQHLDPHHWVFKTWTGVYEHTFFFERAYHAQLFEHEFFKWTNQ
jgi:hypothetical protein